VLRELWRFTKAQLSTGAATAVDWGVLTGLIWAGLHYELAIAAGAFLGAATDFSIKRFWAFESSHLPMGAEAARYAFVSAASLALNCALAYLAVDILGAPKVAGAIGTSIVVGVLWNYPLHRLYVFGRAPSKGVT
jgi:putative flippase GtrA